MREAGSGKDCEQAFLVGPGGRADGSELEAVKGSGGRHADAAGDDFGAGTLEL